MSCPKEKCQKKKYKFESLELRGFGQKGIYIF